MGEAGYINPSHQGLSSNKNEESLQLNPALKHTNLIPLFH